MWPFNRHRNERRARDEPRRSYRVQNLHMIPRPRADRTIEGNEAIYAAVSRIANTLASMTMHFYKGYEIQTTSPLERLVSLEPGGSWTAFSWRQTMEVLRNTEGNAYALRVLDKLGAAQRLDILNPARVQPMRDPTSGEIWYQIALDDGPHLVPGFLILDLKHMSANGIRGIRPIDVLRKSLDYDTAVKELSLDQLDGVNHGIMLTVPNTGLSPDRKNEVVQSFLDTYEKSGRSVVVLEGGLTATNFSAPTVDPQQLDVERITRNRVATVYNLPPHLLGDYSDASPSSTEQMMQEFLTLTMVPIIEQWEEEFNRKMITEADYAAGYRFRFDTSALLRTDAATAAKKHQMAIRGGWMKPNEVRRYEGLPPEKDGDELMCSRDLLPIRIAMEHPELLLGGTAAAAGGKGDEK